MKEIVKTKVAMLTFRFDPTDLGTMCALMDKYGAGDTMFIGHTMKGERITISIFPDKIVYVTCQCNGWVRKNIYWRDGTSEELFVDNWKTNYDKWVPSFPSII